MNRCFPCLRRSVFRQSLVHFLYFSPLRLASSLLFSSTRFLFSGYRKINASATAVSPMIGTIQEILKIPSVTTGSNAVACEYPIRERRPPTIPDENACPSFLAKDYTE